MNHCEQYRPCVGIMLLSKTGHVLVGKRIDNPSLYWQMPQGGIDDNEDPLLAAKRELFEETSVKSIALIHQHPEWFYYDLPEELKGKLWNGRYIGQKQIWFCFGFEGAQSEINIETQNPEFLDWKWLEFERLPEVIVPFKVKLYQKLVNIFRPYQKSL